MWERPFAAWFVEWCMQRFAVALWSSGTRRNIEPIVQHVLPKKLRQHLLFVWAQEECTRHEAKDVATADGLHRKPLLLKELRHVWRRWPAWDAATTVLVDDDPCKCERNPPHTAIHPAKWRALRPPPGAHAELAPDGPLPAYLAALHAAPDSQAYVSEHALYDRSASSADAAAAELSDDD